MKKPSLLILLAVLIIFAQDKALADAGDQARNYSMKKINKSPVIDGDWNDEIWQEVTATSSFTQIEPVENDPPTFKTEVKVYYDDNAIYIAAFCYDPEPDKVLRQLGNRDDDLNADNFRIAIDPYDKQQDFTSFQVTASGVQSDFKNSDYRFNTVWESAVSIQENGWIAEMKIPYSALRFPKEDVQQWAVQFYRHIRRLKEDVIWSPTKREDSNFMNYFGKLTDIKDIDPPVRLSITPFITVQTKTFPDENGNRDFDWLVTGGADLKYGINESFTLDMTLLPDFSQVQSDDVVNNLSAFETVFDEQRPFFQEGVDLFNKANLFYSRRIGSRVWEPNAADNSLADGEKIIDEPEKSKLYNAFKISGRTKKDVGIGVFNAIEGKGFAEIQTTEGGTREVQNDPLSNYNIFVVDKNFKNNKSLFIINTNVTRSDDYRNGNVTAAGFSANFGKNNYNVRGSTSYSVVNEKEEGEDRKMGYQYVFDFDKISGNFRWGWRTEAISEDYDINDLGLNFRTNYYQHGLSMNYNVYKPFSKFLNMYNRFFLSTRQHMETGELSGVWINLGTNTTFAANYLSMWWGANISPFEEKDYYEARNEDQVFRRPRYANFYVGFSSDFRKKFAVETEPYFSVSARNGGSNEYGIWIQPRLRANDHLTFTYGFRVNVANDDIGFADKNEDGESIFGKRDVVTYNNVLTGNYIFKNNLSLGLRARYYWSRVDYERFYELDEEGYTEGTSYRDPNELNNIDYSTFNIDLLFNWEFAPGSNLSISYKNDVFNYSSDIENKLTSNFKHLFDDTQTNILSIRVLYYLDYVTVRGWKNHKRANKNANIESSI